MSRHSVVVRRSGYHSGVPRPWTDTIEEHRSAVREATLDATAELVAEHGLRGVTMSRIAQRTGIGRATLYKYFTDVDAILHAWHERHIRDHLDQLTELRALDKPPDAQLRAVLERYALLQHKQQPHTGSDTASQLHRSEHVAQAHGQLHGLLHELISAAAAAGSVRADPPPDEMATYCLHALAAATELRSAAAVRRLVDLTLASLRA